MRRLICVVVLSCLCIGSSAHASGSYIRRPPKPPKQQERVLYTLGKDIFNGKVSLEQQSESGFKEELSEFQEQLPDTVQQRVNLTMLTGQLNNAQMEALAFYLFKRYKVR